jgi:hypothetical protein
MRITIIIALFVVLLAGTAFAGDKGSGCKLQGTWIGETPYYLAGGPGFYMLKFFVTYHGAGDNEGTEVIDWINPVPAPGHEWSNARGVWEKIGPNKYRYTAYTYGYDEATGDLVEIFRHGGIKHLTDCNTLEATATYEILAPDMTPIMCIEASYTLHRMLQQEPCEPFPPLE